MYSIAPHKAKASAFRLLGVSATLATGALCLTACLGGNPNAAGSPESAERDLFHALLEGDPGVTSYLSAASNKQLDAAAAALAPELDLAAARRAVLASSGVPEPRAIVSVKRIKEAKDEVTLEAKLQDGRAVTTVWRREQGRWVALLNLAPVGGT